ncbi:MAG: DegV family protein, partial [Chloroflexi bacterium]|nr:DegV family protein [Chloroflexota bacterium]
MSKTAARIVSFLQIRPINRLADDGTIQLVEKVRKREAGLNKLLDLIQQEAGTDSLHFLISHANAAEMTEIFCEQLKQKYNCLSLTISDYSPVM